MATVVLNRSSSLGGSDVSGSVYDKAVSVTGSAWTKVQETIPIATDTQIFIAIDVSTVKLFRIHSTVACTVQTNDGTTPDDTLSLVANKAYDYVTGDYTPFLLTVDVADIFVTSAAEGVLTIEVLQDATP